MKKAVHIGLVVVTVVLLIAVIVRPQIVDSAVLLESKHPRYFEFIDEKANQYIEDENGAYLVTHILKDGFGAFTPIDMDFYMKRSEQMYPEISRALLCFTDGTGVEIQEDTARYGEIDETGDVVDGETIDLTVPLINQIGDLTILDRDYDDRGNLIYQFRTDRDGNGVGDESGVAGFKREYDESGKEFWRKNDNLISEQYLGTDGTPVNGRYGYAEVRREYDGRDLISESYYDYEGNPVNRIDILYAAINIEYDENHNRIHEQYFGADGSPVKSNSGFAEVRCVYDSRNIISESYFGADGEPVMLGAGYASVSRIYDGEGNATSENYYGIDGRPITCAKGYVAVQSVYDDANHPIEQSYFDESGKLTISSYGYAKIKRTYDEGDHIVEESYYGTDGQAMQMAGGYYGIGQKWDGNTLVERIYLDISGAPAVRTDGYSKAVWERDEHGTWNVHFKDSSDREIAIEGLNLVKDVRYGPDGWSEWMSPQYGVANSCLNIGTVNLGDNAEGDVYTCSLEIEFRDVTVTEGQELRFWTQGAQDGGWTTGNVWNGNLVNLTGDPEGGIYEFTCSNAVSEEMVGVSRFDIGFRCDYWKSGVFRVRNVKIEKGEMASRWSPGV